MARVTKFNTKNLREGVIRCLDEAVQLAHDVERRGRLFQAHTRWGKTPAIRLLAYCMNYGYVDPQTGEMFPPCSSTHVLVTPGKHLVDQAIDDDKWNHTVVKLFEINAPTMMRTSISSTIDHQQINPNGERFLAVTIQQLIELDKGRILRDWISHIQHVHKLPMVFHFDETHFNNESKPWGELVLRVQEYGAVTIGWTATPQRADYGVIPGARVTVRGQTDGKETVLKKIRTDENGDRWAVLEDREVSITDLIIHPDVAITFSQGWNNNYILKVDPDFIDVHLDQIGIDGSEEGARMLSELSTSFIRKNSILRTTVEHPIYIRRCARMVARALPRYVYVQVLIFSNSDSKVTKGRDRHANLIKRIFREEIPSLSIGIDTGNSDEPGAAMKKFENGGYDALIVKRMGAVGWDVPKIMIVVDMSVDRTAARCMQAWMRGATLNDDAVVFTLILPQDQIALDIFNTEIDREGGRAELKDIAPIGEREEPIKPSDRPYFNVRDTEHGDFVDSDRIMAPRDQMPIIDWFLQQFPAISHQYTQPDIASKIQDKFKPEAIPADKPSERTDTLIIDKQSAVTTAMENYISLTWTGVYSRNYQAEWEEHSRKCWHELRLHCGGYDIFPKDASGKVIGIRKIRDMTLLEKMERHATIMAEQVRRGNYQA